MVLEAALGQLRQVAGRCRDQLDVLRAEAVAGEADAGDTKRIREAQNEVEAAQCDLAQQAAVQATAAARQRAAEKAQAQARRAAAGQ